MDKELLSKSMTTDQTEQGSTLSKYKDGDKHTPCEKCGTPTMYVMEVFGKLKNYRIMCECRQKEVEEQERQEEFEEKQRRLQDIRSKSIMDSTFYECTFEKAEIRPCDEKYYRAGKKYVAEWERMYSENIGLLLTGVPGNGKTYLTSCIANALMDELVPVVCVSVNGLLDRIKQTYSTYGKDSDWRVINQLKNARLLIIDDLGAGRATEWVQTKLYEIIDSRYRDKKPVIITSNLSMDALRDYLTHDGVSRTFDRIGEMCTHIEVKADPRRRDIAKQKREIVKGLFE